MGGSALKNTFTERKSAADYFEIVEEVEIAIKPLSVECIEIPAYTNKESFGDADILIIPRDPNTLREDLLSGKYLPVPNELVHNGGVYSFDYKNFQIDLIVRNQSNFSTSYHYYSYNDLGNLIGRIAHKVGLKYGHEGPIYPIKLSDSEELGEVVVSTNMWTILEFLGYDWFEYRKGFNTLEDIFKFVVSSPFFNKSIYDYDALNHTNRTRNRKRQTYGDFLEWLQVQEGLPEYQFQDKLSYLPTIQAFFHVDIYGKWRKLWGEHLVKRAANSKLTGLEISEMTGKIGKELGETIVGFRKSFNSNISYEDYMLVTPKSKVVENFKNWFDNQNKIA